MVKGSSVAIGEEYLEAGLCGSEAVNAGSNTGRLEMMDHGDDIRVGRRPKSDRRSAENYWQTTGPNNNG